MQEIRCSKCNKMLAMKHPYSANYEDGVKENVERINHNTWRLELKCPRCKTLTELVVY